MADKKIHSFANRKQRHSWEAALNAIIITGLLTALCWLLHPFMELSNLAMIYMLGVCLIAYRCGRTEAMLGSLLTVLAFDFFFVPPTFTFAVENLRFTVTFAVMLSVSLIISTLVLRLREQSESTQNKERQTALLLRMSKTLANCRSNQEACETVSQILFSEIRVQTKVFWPETCNPGKDILPEILQQQLQLACNHWFSSQKEAARLSADADNHPGQGFHLPLSYSGNKTALFGVFSASRHLLPEELEYIEGISHLLSSTLGRLDSEAEVNAAQIREQQQELRNILLSSISHDLRTPLTEISLSASILENQLAADSSARVLAMEIQESAEKLTKIVRNVLDLSRLESGNLSPNKEWHSIEEIIGVALRRCAALLQSRKIIAEISPNYPMIFVDGLLIEQCLINLLENAARYTAENSTIEISAKEESGQNVLRIRDNGAGFESGIEPYLFEKMVRGKKSQGVGLGLAICKAVILAHGGTISACNQTSGGAEITIRLPVEFEPPEVKDDE